MSDLTRIRLQLAIYFCLHRGECLLKRFTMASLVWIADAHRGDGKRFIVRADEILTAFLELESMLMKERPYRFDQFLDVVAVPPQQQQRRPSNKQGGAAYLKYPGSPRFDQFLDDPWHRLAPKRRLPF